MKFDKINSHFISEFTLVNHCYEITWKELSINQILKKLVKHHSFYNLKNSYMSTRSRGAKKLVALVFLLKIGFNFKRKILGKIDEEDMRKTVKHMCKLLKNSKYDDSEILNNMFL